MNPKERSFIQQVAVILDPYQRRLKDVFSSYIARLGPETTLRKACAYAMNGGGKRLRPALVWMVADELRSPVNVDLAALAVESFHISSLIIDDLPCMDNDDFRRGEPTTHKVFSEAEAILASYALTASGFEALTSISVSSDIIQRAVYQASRAIGLCGLIGGQHLDTTQRSFSKEMVLTMIDQKTSVLFDVACSFGWMFGGGDVNKLPLVHTMCSHFGRAFQLLDDILDMEQDAKVEHHHNFALLFGEREAMHQLSSDVKKVEELCDQLALNASPIVSLAQAMGSIA